MDLITYGYNMAFLLLFSAVLSSCSTTYGLTGRRIYRYFAWLMFAFLLESALSAAVNIWTSSTPDTLFSRGGLLCDILNAADAAVEIYLVGAILYALFPPRRKTGAYAAVAAVLLMLVTSLIYGGYAGDPWHSAGGGGCLPLAQRLQPGFRRPLRHVFPPPAVRTGPGRPGHRPTGAADGDGDAGLLPPGGGGGGALHPLSPGGHGGHLRPL